MEIFSSYTVFYSQDEDYYSEIDASREPVGDSITSPDEMDAWSEQVGNSLTSPDDGNVSSTLLVSVAEPMFDNTAIDPLQVDASPEILQPIEGELQ